MQLVADTHAAVFYLTDPDRLSDTALEALGQAEEGRGITISAATLADLWYVSHKTGSSALAPGDYETVRATILDPQFNFMVATISVDTMKHFGDVPKQALPDPFDRFILATAVELGLPLVTADAKIAESGVAQIIW